MALIPCSKGARSTPASGNFEGELSHVDDRFRRLVTTAGVMYLPVEWPLAGRSPAVPVSNDDRCFVVVSGLPASGKTTLARTLAPAIGLSFIDKDQILEALFGSLGVRDLAWRQLLSRASDAVMAELAETSRGAVLTSFWRHADVANMSGTPVHWVRELSSDIVEVYCDCSPSIALKRFTTRRRHPGHCDHERNLDELAKQFEAIAERSPLGVGRLIVIDANGQDSIDSHVQRIVAALEP